MIVAYSPKQNNVIERKSRTIVEMTNSMLHEKKLLYYLWGKAANTTVYLLNRCFAKAMKEKTPFEAFSGRKPKSSLSRFLNVFAIVTFLVN